MCVSVSSVVVELKDGLVRCGRMSDGSIQREGEQCRKEREKDMEVVMQNATLNCVLSELSEMKGSELPRGLPWRWLRSASKREECGYIFIDDVRDK